MVPLQADIPAHRTSLRAHTRHRRSPSRRMSGPGHEKIFHRLFHVKRPNNRDIAPGKPNPGQYPLQRLRSSDAHMSLLQAHLPLRRHSRIDRQRHTRRHQMQQRRLQTSLPHSNSGRAIGTRHPPANEPLLRRLPHLRRQRLRQPHAANERVRASLLGAEGPRGGMSGPHEV